MTGLVLAPLCLAVAAAACPGGSTGEDDEDSPVRTVVDPTTSVGTVGGAVTNFADGKPLDGTTVNLFAGGRSFTATTDTSGRFGFTDVPAGGSVRLALSKDGFFPAELEVALQNAAGNFPTNSAHAYVGPVALLAYGQTPLKVTVYQPNGQPAADARVFMDLPVQFVLVDGWSQYSSRGSVHREMKSGADGMAQFTDMPDAASLATRFPLLSVSITVAGFGVDDQGRPKAMGQTRQILLMDLTTESNAVVMVLQPYKEDEGLKVLTSSLPDVAATTLVQIPGDVEPSGASTSSLLRVVFNQPVLLSTVDALMVAEDGQPLNPNGALTRLTVQVPSGTASPDTLSSVIDLLMPRAEPGTEANLSLRVATGVGSQAFAKSVPVYFAQPATPTISAIRQLTVVNPNRALDRGEVMEAVLNMPVGGRKVDGTAVASTDFLPIQVTITHGLETLRTTGKLVEPVPPQPYVTGGFTTHVQFTLPSTTPAVGLDPTIAMDVKLEFNDAAKRDGGVAGGLERVTNAKGVPVLVVSGNMAPQWLQNEENGGSNSSSGW